MNYTIDKLDEAEFFLSKLKEHKNIFPEFDYYLNAFVGSARAVLWIMKSEYDSNDNWRNWYENKTTSESEMIVLKGITNMRNRSLKRAPLKTKKYPILHSGSEFFDVYKELKEFIEKNGRDKKYSLEIKEVDDFENHISTNEKELRINGVLNVYDTVEEFKDSNVIDKCEEYFLWLKSLVEECMSLFNNQVN